MYKIQPQQFKTILQIQQSSRTTKAIRILILKVIRFIEVIFPLSHNKNRLER